MKIQGDKRISIDIWSDVVCPFCLVGKKKIEQAIIKLNAEDQVEIIWHSFQLDPDFPLNKSISSTLYLSEKKGYPVSQINSMQDQLTFNSKSYGIDFEFDKALMINTMDLHRLIQWAKTLYKSNELKEAFMTALFCGGLDLSLNETIIDVTRNVGLDIVKAKEILESEEYKTNVLQDITLSKEMGIRGVPYFLINNEMVLSGAQDDKIFEESLSGALNSVFNSDNSN